MQSSRCKIRGRPRDQVCHDDILEAALSLLDEQCYSEITIERIAARAKCGKPTIYRRWKTKADLVLEAYAERATRTVPPIAPSDDVLHDLKIMLVQLFEVARQPMNERAVRSFVAEAQFDVPFREKFYAMFLEKRRGVVRELLQHGVAIGQIRSDLDAEATIDMIYGAFIFRLLFGHGDLNGRLAGQIVGVLRSGIVKAEPTDV